MQGKVYFVGAGPGHPGLITIRGRECLRRAESVLYDYLVNTEIVREASPQAELICLGRHRRADIWPQERINEELVRRALQGQTVVRLKGGDPLVFGRLGQELAAVAEAGVPFEIVPGVTAGLAAGACAGLPLTDRDQASAVALVTAQQRAEKGETGLDYEALARFPGTLVFYMGVTTVRQWSNALIRAGKPADTPALVVRRVSLADQLTVPSTLGQLATELTPRQRVPPPVVVIVGDVAASASRFAWWDRRPLAGVSVLVTRPAGQAAEMGATLAELGAEVLLQPAIVIEEPQDWQPVDAALADLSAGKFDHLVFSSANGVHRLLGRLLSRDYDMRALAGTELSVIGPGTARALAEYHLRADRQPREFRAEALASLLVPEARGRRFLLVRASRGREWLAKELRRAGGVVTQIVVYRSTDVDAPDPAIARRLEEEGGLQWVTVTSSAIARSLVRMFGQRLRNTRLVSISPLTSEALREAGFPPQAEAASYTTQGVIDALVRQQSPAG
jgi:uroporphyrinogen III methyltransferase/synthase